MQDAFIGRSQSFISQQEAAWYVTGLLSRERDESMTLPRAAALHKVSRCAMALYDLLRRGGEFRELSRPLNVWYHFSVGKTVVLVTQEERRATLDRLELRRPDEKFTDTR